MSSVLTETSVFGATTTVPSDGDAATAASINGAVQTLANRTQFLKNGLLDCALTGSGVSNDGSTNLQVGAFSVVIGGVVYHSAATSFALSGLLAGNFYYLYYNAGVGLLLTATVPDAALRFETASSVRRYLCCVRALSATTVRPFRMSFRSGQYVWRGSALASNSLDVLSAGSAGSYTDVSLAAFVPPHARLARLRASVDLTNSISTCNLRTKGDTVGESFQVTGIRKHTAEVDIETDSAQTIQYQIGTAGTVTLTCTGFGE